MQILLSLGGIYLFILLGYVAKRRFGTRIDEKTLILLSIYVLQPILIFWGFTLRKIDIEAVQAPLLFVAIMAVVTVVAIVLTRPLFTDRLERSVAVATGIVGNTGNLGIPLGIALFGPESVLYTSMINLVNILLVYTVGVYFYARGRFAVGDALRSIARLPAIWFALGASLFNICDLHVPPPLSTPLTMGAYATMVVQLLIFGIYLEGVKRAHIGGRLLLFVGGFKFLLVPAIGWAVLSLFSIAPLVREVVLLEIIVPVAVMNVNLAALYECKPSEVAFLTFATSLIFLLYLPLALSMMR